MVPFSTSISSLTSPEVAETTGSETCGRKFNALVALAAQSGQSIPRMGHSTWKIPVALLTSCASRISTSCSKSESKSAFIGSGEVVGFCQKNFFSEGVVSSSNEK